MLIRSASSCWWAIASFFREFILLKDRTRPTTRIGPIARPMKARVSRDRRLPIKEIIFKRFPLVIFFGMLYTADNVSDWHVRKSITVHKMEKAFMRVTWQLSILRGVLFAGLLLLSTEAVIAAGNQDKFVIAAVIYGKNNTATWEGFKEAMKEKGYIEGQNVNYLFDDINHSLEKLDANIARMISSKPDLIFAATTPVAIAVTKATTLNRIPVVFGPVNDPMSVGIVKEQRHPGENVTGVMLTDSTAKELEWALKIAPRIKRILLPYNPNDKSSVKSMQKASDAAKMFKLTLDAREIQNHKEIDNLLANFPDGIDAIFLPRDGMVMSRVEDFAKVANPKKIILTGTRVEMAERGALFGFGFNGYMIGKQMARLADQILQGRKPGELPVETAENYLSINLKTANILGITISEHILRQAHTIIRAE